MNLSNRTLVMVIVGLAVCLYGAYRLFSSPTKKQETKKNSVTSSAISSLSDDSQNEKFYFSKKNENAKDIEQLMAEIATLRQQVAQLATTKAKLEVDNPEEKNKNPEETMFDPKKVEKSKKEHQEKMESLEDKFYSEPEDPKWSSSALSTIQEAIQPNEVMRNAVRKIECHSSMCRLELADDQSKAVFESIDAFSQKLTPDLSRLIVHSTEEGDGEQTVVLYVSRENTLVPNR